jgi:hypothetical protein
VDDEAIEICQLIVTKSEKKKSKKTRGTVSHKMPSKGEKSQEKAWYILAKSIQGAFVRLVDDLQLISDWLQFFPRLKIRYINKK